MIPATKIKPHELILSCANVKGEMLKSMEDENRYSNIDSAKKRAVTYGMDYDGFRQMVLGANLYCVKSKEYEELANLQRGRQVINQSQGVFAKEVDIDEEQLRQLSMRFKSELRCENFL